MVFKSLLSLKSAGIKPSPWIHIVHILIIKPDSCTQVQTFISGISGYLGYLANKVCYCTRGITVLLAIPADLWHNSLMDTNLTWDDGDIWKGWTYSPKKNCYYFNDIGHESLATFWADEFLNQAYE